jgi:hypothetical protein
MTYGGTWRNGVAHYFGSSAEASSYVRDNFYYNPYGGDQISRNQWLALGGDPNKSADSYFPGGWEQNGNVQGSDFFYDHNDGIGLGLSILEPGFGVALETVVAEPELWTNGAKILGGVGGAAVIGANVALTGYTVYQETQNGRFNTHSYINAAVTGVSAVATGVGLAIATGAIVVTSPIWGTGLLVGGAALGVGYGIAQVAGIDGWIDSNWGMQKK